MIAYLQGHGDSVLRYSVQHLQLCGTALAIAIVVALPVGILISRYAVLYTPIMGVLGAAYTIPSLALFALLVPTFGIGTATTTIALVIYAQFILVRNIVAGLRSVDATTIEAARGMGMSAPGILWRVELPLALPIIVAGVRIATVTTIGVATVATYIAAGGLGTILSEGVRSAYNEEIEAGALAIGLLAIMADLILRVIESLVARAAGRTPRAAMLGR